MRLPDKQAERLATLRRAFEALQRATGAEPTVEELAQATAISPADVADLLRVSQSPLSLDAPLTEEGNGSRLDVLPSGRLLSSEAAYVYASMLHEVHALLEHLEPRQAAILRARFGFDGEPRAWRRLVANWGSPASVCARSRARHAASCTRWPRKKPWMSI